MTGDITSGTILLPARAGMIQTAAQAAIGAIGCSPHARG